MWFYVFLVKLNNGKYSTSFDCNIGVRQGENLSPLLFSIYLNDLTECMSNAYDGLSLTNDLAYRMLDTDEVMGFVRLYLLLYADDSTAGGKLQAALYAMQHYCTIWKLEVNVNKTKFMIFSRGRSRNTPNFVYNGNRLEVVSAFRYLGVDFKFNGKFLSL